jgi:hypothetical protein
MLKRCTVVKKQGFGGSRKVRFFGQKLDVKKHENYHKICPCGALGSSLLIFGAFGTGCFFDGFRDRKKWVQNLENLTKVVPSGDRGEPGEAGPRPRRVPPFKGG